MKKTLVIWAATAIASLGIASSASAAIEYDQNVTSNVIMGNGIANGGWTTDREAAFGIELGLRGKLRHDPDNNGDPQNIFYSNGDGSYNFDAGLAIDPNTDAPFVDEFWTFSNDESLTAIWNIEWSINSNTNGNGKFLNEYTYQLGMDSDPTQDEDFIIFDPINSGNRDNSFGNNTTPQSGGIEAPTFFGAGEYADLIAENNLAQNSWKAHTLLSGFDPTIDGVYSFYLAAFNTNDVEIARTNVEIIVGQGAAVVPLPGAAALGFLGMGLIGLRRRFQKTQVVA